MYPIPLLQVFCVIEFLVLVLLLALLVIVFSNFLIANLSLVSSCVLFIMFVLVYNNSSLLSYTRPLYSKTARQDKTKKRLYITFIINVSYINVTSSGTEQLNLFLLAWELPNVMYRQLITTCVINWRWIFLFYTYFFFIDSIVCVGS